MHLYDETVHKWLAKNSTVSGACSDNSLWRFLFRGLPTDHNIRQYYQYALPSSLCRNPKQVTKPIFSMTSWLGLGQAYQESWRCPIYNNFCPKWIQGRWTACLEVWLFDIETYIRVVSASDDIGIVLHFHFTVYLSISHTRMAQIYYGFN